MFRNKIKAGLLLAALAFSAPVFAEGGFKVPVHFNLELVDGVTNPESYSRFNCTVELEPGPSSDRSFLQGYLRWCFWQSVSTS